MKNKLIQHTLLLSCSHFFVRAIGFLMRIWLSRELGAAAMGLVELAQSAQMLLITPVISGLPAAISRMSAKAADSPRRQISILRCGIGLSLSAGLVLSTLAFFLRHPLARWLGDMRTLPALLIYLPCIPILGVSCALNGYYYGISRPVAPAVSEILEQLVRFLLSIRLVSLLRNWPLTLRSAIPALGALAGETVGLLFMLLLCIRPLFALQADGHRRDIVKEMLSLALPLTGIRLVSSLMRTVSSTMLPARLQLAGLSQGEALSQLGMMNGMLMPILMLPSFVTGSLCMVSAPELTRRQTKGLPMRALCLRIGTATLCVGLFSMAGIWALAPFIADKLYRQSELLPMLRVCSPLIPVMALLQVTSGMMNGLGQQGASLRISLVTNLICILMTYALASNPALKIQGALIAMGVSHLLTLFLNLCVLKQTISLHSK